MMVVMVTSRRVGQVTLVASERTSCRNLNGLIAIVLGSASVVRRFTCLRESEQPTFAQPSFGRMSRQAGSIVRGISKPRRISVFSGPAAGGGYVLPDGRKVKVWQDVKTGLGPNGAGADRPKINGFAGRSGRARTRHPPVLGPRLHQLSLPPAGNRHCCRFGALESKAH